MDAFVAWLSNAGWTVFAWSIALLLVIDVVAIVAAASTRDRTLVNRWTGRVLAANLALLGIGAAGPAVAFTGRMAMSGVAMLMPNPTATMTVIKDAPSGQRRR